MSEKSHSKGEEAEIIGAPKEETQKTNLPTLAELSGDIEAAFKNDQLNFLLNVEPPQTWIKFHPTVKTKDDEGRYHPAKYIPIEKIEFLLTKIFQHWRVEVLREGSLFNSVYVAIRLHYLNPINKEWMCHDGLGAVGIQTDAGAAASDMAKIKQDAVMKALPAAKSYAIKDAADHIGRLFGKDLNRQDALVFEPKNAGYNRIFDKPENPTE